jgi:hypothetical protein
VVGTVRPQPSTIEALTRQSHVAAPRQFAPPAGGRALVAWSDRSDRRDRSCRDPRVGNSIRE